MHIYVCIYACMYTYICIHYVCIHIYIYIYVYMYTHTRTDIDTDTDTDSVSNTDTNTDTNVCDQTHTRRRLVINTCTKNELANTRKRHTQKGKNTTNLSLPNHRLRGLSSRLTCDHRTSATITAKRRRTLQNLTVGCVHIGALVRGWDRTALARESRLRFEDFLIGLVDKSLFIGLVSIHETSVFKGVWYMATVCLRSNLTQDP